LTVDDLKRDHLSRRAGARLAEPLEAMYVVTSGPSCKRKLNLAAGGEVTALEIQRRLLDIAERSVDVLPPWVAAVSAFSRQALDELEGAPDSAATTLDWAIRLRLFRARTQSRGFPETRIAFLNSILGRLKTALAAQELTTRAPAKTP
jgi:hypothetical protein